MEKATQDKATLSVKKHTTDQKYFMYSVYIHMPFKSKVDIWADLFSKAVVFASWWQSAMSDLII